MDISFITIMIIIGAITGMVTGITGASGVMIFVPLVTMVLKFSIHEAIGTSLMVNVISSLAITYIYYKHGNINLKSGIWIAIGSIIGAQVGTGFSVKIPEISLGAAFGIFMAGMGIAMWKKGINRESVASTTKKILNLETQTQKIMAVLILGFFVGIMTGIFGAGGGVMILLILIFVLNFPIHMAIGTSSLLMTITACSGAFGYALHGNIRILPGLITGISAAGSGVAGALFADRANEQILAMVIGILYIMLGIVMTILSLW